ncbi:hypothetical protein [Brenneria tiliae]|uniref:hypothetical protein n=1 Tax=Brenneria tiliae TaxID=2914984 RepID=UPI002014F95B|nr:hypothetical protein [Brenneria tiliae]MCL2896127.1 hypothetical protein [Brenneria tiliae]MCL2900678.1 hypothetical protein [Brenneria tiliae]
MTATIVFTASVVKSYKENDVLTVALGDDPIKPHNFFIITRLDDEDNATVDDNIGFQTHHSEYEASGAISEVLLTQESLTVHIKPEYAQHFGGICFVGKFIKSEDLDGEVTALSGTLKEMFAGSRVLLKVENN